MKSTGILIREHTLILQALEHLETAAKRLEIRERPPLELFLSAVDFFGNFAGRFHHYKEEYLMFGLLAEKHEGDLDLSIGILRHEHERCRHYIQEIDTAAPGYETGDEIAEITLLENLSPYISLLRRHIHKEDHLFFKMVEKHLSQSEDEDLVRGFAAQEQLFGGEGVFDKYRKRVSEMGDVVRS